MDKAKAEAIADTVINNTQQQDIAAKTAKFERIFNDKSQPAKARIDAGLKILYVIVYEDVRDRGVKGEDAFVAVGEHLEAVLDTAGH